MNWSWSYSERVSPNIGVVTLEEQDILRTSCVGVAGCGAIGGHVANDLAYWGIGHMKLADNDTFETSNANRQLFAAFSTVGKQKVEVVSEKVRDISPEIRTDIFADGITFANVEEFVAGCDAVVDAIDYEKPQFSVALNRAARVAGVKVYTAQCIGFGASLFVFYPDGMTYEELVGLSNDTPISEIKFEDADLAALCPILPTYIPKDILAEVLAGERETPTVIAGQTVATGLLVTELVLNLVRPERRGVVMSAYDACLNQMDVQYAAGSP